MVSVKVWSKQKDKMQKQGIDINFSYTYNEFKLKFNQRRRKMKRKKFISLISVLLICLMAFMAISINYKVKGYTEQVDGITWYYTISGNNAVNVYVASGTPSGTLTIPETLGGYTVTSIRGVATSASASGKNILGATTNNTTITKVVIPNTVTSIGNNTFSKFNALTEIDIPDSVTNIEQYAFYNCQGLKKINFGSNSNLQIINNYAFNNCYKLEKLNMPNTVTTIGSYSFGNCSGLKEITLSNKLEIIGAQAFYNASQISNELIIPDTVTQIGDYAFYNNRKISGNLVIPSSVKSIGQRAFYDCQNIQSLTLNEGINSIGSYAFQGCSGIKGDLIIPDSVTVLGANAFATCSSIDGTIRIGSGVRTIENYTFSACTNVYKIIVGPNVTSIGYGSFQGFEDIWIENTEENVSVNTNFAGYDKTATIHWLGETHKINVSVPQGVKVINVNTSSEMTTGDYECDSSFEFKIDVDNSYNYNNLKLVIMENNDEKNARIYDVNSVDTYKIDRLTKDHFIGVQNLETGLDLSLRTFITEINREKVTDSREPVSEMENGDFVYAHTKNPIKVKKGNFITYKIRVYNEGMTDGTANKISMYIPEGLELVETNKTNTTYKWVKESDGKISSTYLANKSVKGYVGLGAPKYEELEVLLQVSSDVTTDEEIRLLTLCQIEEQSAQDADSTLGSISTLPSKDYKEQESKQSTNLSYIKGIEDDDDFENVVLEGKIKVDYKIRINKIDSDTKELLAGAKFNLLDKDGNVLKTSVTTQEGVLDFGMMTTLGEGDDIYYIEEVATPEGYVVLERTKIKLVVTKTLVDENQGTYSVKVVCEVLDFRLDTTRYEFIPIFTAEQFRKIGSGETIKIDGVNYEYKADGNYKLMSDIDASNIEWEPIQTPFKGIIDGNNHKIINMHYSSDSDVNIKEIGMFRYVDGIIENLELENVQIHIKGIAEDATGITNYSGVGAIAGVMGKGTIRNCKVSGSITASTDNIGGFVGHTIPYVKPQDDNDEENKDKNQNGIIKIQNCTNNASVTGEQTTKTVNESTVDVKPSNIGGLVGCALSSISIGDCTNNGTITCCNYNVGGLVGYVKPCDYEEVNITADFDETEKVIELVVKNTRTTGKYELVLETIDAKTLGLIEGAVYTILDKNRNSVHGCENVKLVDGKLKVATIDINTLGIDTYYIKEVETVPGYSKLTGNIKLEVRRYWDSETESFKVSVEKGNLSDDEYKEDVPSESKENIPSQTGSIFTKVNFENVSFNTCKAEFKGCINNGEINSTYMNAAGIVGTAHDFLSIEDCENKGNVQAIGFGKASGIVSEIQSWKTNKYIEIKNCKNSGEVTSKGTYGSAGGIVSQSLCDIKINNCYNTGKIAGTAGSCSAGILADANGIIFIDECSNEGEIIAENESNSWGDVNCVAGGILGKNATISEYSKINGISTQKSDNYTKITNCESKGNISSNCHTGGIIANAIADTVQVVNCNVEDIFIHDTYAGDKGGIIGLLGSDNIEVKDCNINNVDLDRTSEVTGNTYGATGGVIGNMCKYAMYNDQSDMNSVKIMNCKVANSNIKTQGKEAAGIVGCAYGSREVTNISITDCVIDNCDVLNRDTYSTYSASGGICGVLYEAGNININNNIVNKTSIESSLGTSSYANDCNVGGIIGGTWSLSKSKISNNDVLDCTINNNGSTSDGCSTIGGVVGLLGMQDNNEAIGNISNCNIINTDITTHAGNLGGILGVGYKGYTGEAYKITNCKVEGGTLYSDATNSSNSVIAGIGAAFYGRGELYGCTVNNCHILQKTKEESAGTNTAGIVGWGYQSIIVDNCNVYNSEIYSEGKYGTYSGMACTAGIASCVMNGAKITNSNVDNTTITSTKGANATGILATTLSSDAVVENCSVTNSDITNLTTVDTNRGNATSSGLIGNSYGSNGAIINNCKVEKTNIIGNGAIMSGVMACGKTINITNTIIKDVTLKDNSQENTSSDTMKSAGGISGFVMNVNTENVNVDGLDITSHSRSVGGLYGIVCSINKLENCNVNRLTINNNNPTKNVKYGSVAGLIGDITSDIKNPIKNNSVKNSIITTSTDNVGGLFGTMYPTSTIDNCTVDNVKLENKYSSESTHGLVGGLVGVNSNTININNSKVKNSSAKITGTLGDIKHVGGLIGITYGANIVDTDVDNTVIQNNTPGNTGGFVGMTYYSAPTTNYDEVIKQINITNSNVKNNSNITGNGHVGGILGFGKLVTVSGKVTNTTVNGTNSSSEVGGVIGNSLSTSDIKNIDVDNVTITSNSRSAGIAGLGTSNITECNVLNSKISTNSETAEVGGITASACNSGSEITKCNVKNTNISSLKGFAGGIAGFANNTITSSNLVNSTVTSTGEGANGLGGIVGHGSNMLATKTYLEDCEVNGCTLSGVNGVGGIAGVAVSEIVNCRVIGVETQGESSTLSTLYVGSPVVLNSENQEESGINNSNDNENKLENNDNADSTKENGKNTEENSGNTEENNKSTEENLEKNKENDSVEEKQVEKNNLNDNTEESSENKTLENETKDNTNEIKDNTNQNGGQNVENSKLNNTKNGKDAANKTQEISVLKSPTLTQETPTATYTTTITGKENVGGIVGDGGQLFGETTNTFVTLTNCVLRGTKITGTTNIKEAIGRNSYFTGDTTIYDVIKEFISESFKLVTQE